MNGKDSQIPTERPFEGIGTLASSLSIVYICLPIYIFLFYWTTLLVAVPGTIALTYSLFKCYQLNRCMMRPKLDFQSVAIVVFCATVASAWCLTNSLTPTSIPFIDYAKHEAILHDLITLPWPAAYFKEDSNDTILRYSFAYYLIPAGFAKVIGIQFASVILYVWNLAGVFLFLAYVASLSKTKSFAYIAIVIAALFSGLDALVVIYKGISLAEFRASIVDAWPRSYGCGWLIGSNSFSLRWSPQHTIAAFLSSVIIHKSWNSERFFQRTAITFAALVLWSPFVAISFSAIVAAKVFNRFADFKNYIRTTHFAIASLLTAITSYFILSDPQGVPSGLCFGAESTSLLLLEYALFVTLEFGIYVALIWLCKKHLPYLAAISIVLLCILPFIMVGAANDLHMRGSQIPMCIIGFYVIDSLQVPQRYFFRAAMYVMVIIGAGTGLQESLRSPSFSINEFSWSKPIISVDWDGTTPGSNYQVISQYVAKTPNKALASILLRHPSRATELGAPIQISTISSWSEFGNAEFITPKNKISSESATDAALYSEPVHLSKGLYRIEALMSWDTTGEIKGYGNAAHLSILGLKKLVNIQNSTGNNRKITIFTTFSGEPSRIAFGLGGWAKGKGFVQLHSIQITRVPM